MVAFYLDPFMACFMATVTSQRYLEAKQIKAAGERYSCHLGECRVVMYLGAKTAKAKSKG